MARKRNRRPAPCPSTGFPRYNTSQEAWKAGSKIIRHPEDTALFIDKCDDCRAYHFIVKDRRNTND